MNPCFKLSASGASPFENSKTRSHKAQEVMYTISTKSLNNRSGISKRVSAIAIVLIITVAGVSIFTLSKVTSASTTIPSSTSSGLNEDYLKYLTLSDPSATVVNGSVNSCDILNFMCMVTVNSNSEVTFNFIIDSSLDHSIRMDLMLNGSIQVDNGLTRYESTQELQLRVIVVNPSSNSESVSFLLPSDAVNNDTTNIGAQLKYCRGVASSCSFSNTPLLYLSTGYAVDTG